MSLSIGENEILVGLGEGPVTQRLDRSNRHGVVAGATGTGKTVTLQVLAQAFSDAGVPVFAADVKGDLSGVAMPGTPNEKMLARAQSMDLALSPAANARFGITLLKDFSERNPLTRFKVVVAPSREIVYGVSDGRWELGFGPLQHTMPDYFAIHTCFSETRRLMIARDHPSRDALKRDPQATLRSLPLVTSYLDDLARRPGGDRLRNAFASVWEVSHMDLRLSLVAEGKAAAMLPHEHIHA